MNRQQLLIRLGYDGARFHGVHPQPGFDTVGAALRRRFEKLGLLPKAICFSARTDAGVHAESNVATLWVRPQKSLPQLIQQLQEIREDGLYNLRVQCVSSRVHARGSARAKHYRYRLQGGFPPLVKQSPRTWCVYPKLDLARARAAAAMLEGTHDFTSFRTRRCGALDPHRSVERIEVSSFGQGSSLGLQIDVWGKSFLRRMVRVMVGTIAVISAGLREVDHIPAIFSAKKRSAAGPTAAPHGLTLMSVALSVDPEHLWVPKSGQLKGGWL